METLIGKKVWVIQYDEEDHVLAVCEGIDAQFIKLRQEHETEPSLYMSLNNVKEIQVFRPEGEGELRYLRAVATEDTSS